MASASTAGGWLREQTKDPKRNSAGLVRGLQKTLPRGEGFRRSKRYETQAIWDLIRRRSLRLKPNAEAAPSKGRGPGVGVPWELCCR